MWWEVQDKNGTIHSGSEDEMRMAFSVLKNHDVEILIGEFNITKKKAQLLMNKYMCRWDGDIKLCQVHDIYR